MPMPKVKSNIGDYKKTYKNWKWNLPTFYNLSSEIDKWADDPRKMALHWLDDTGRTVALSYKELRDYSNQFANALRKHGVKKGDKVAIITPRLPATYVAYLGIVKTGAVAVPVSQLYAPRAMQHVFDNSGAKFLITTDILKATLLKNILPKCKGVKKTFIVGHAKGKDIPFWEALLSEPRECKIEKTRGKDLSTFLYTSGTTGMPKGVMQTHHWLLGNIPQVRFWQDVHDGDMVWCTADLSWITGLINAFLGPLSQGATILSYNGRFNAAKWFELIETYKVNVLVSAPTAFRLIMAQEKTLKKKYTLALRHVGGIGERVNDEIIRWWKKRFGIQVYDGYGQTECMAFICNYPGMKVKTGSAGRPTPGHVVTIREEATGKEITKPNTRGMVTMKIGSSPVLTPGYWKNKAKTNKVMRGAWYYTGDAAYKDKDGYIWIMGRDDDVIKSSGYRVGPYEVESTLLENPAVKEAAVIGKPDKIFGHIIKALIVLKVGHKGSPALVKELQQHVKKQLAVYKYPKEVVFVKELPKTNSGKIKRKILRLEEEKAYEKAQKKGKKSKK